MIPAPIELVTNRLLIRPLTHSELLLYLQLDNELERSLGLDPYPRVVPDELKEAFEQTILPQVQVSENYLYSTIWTMIDKVNNCMVGDLCFKGPPNDLGEIEIGYGTYDDFQGKGYMTEAIGALARWALDQPGVHVILAETDKKNISSHKTLSKNGFMMFREVDNMIWWRLNRTPKYKY